MAKLSCCLALIVLTLTSAAMPAEAQKGVWKDLSVRVGDIKMHYLDAGAGERYLVFIPGWTMTAEVWREQFPYFAARDFHVIAFDPRSQGLTTKTEGGNTYQQQAADLHAFLKALKIDEPILIGWSAGVTVLLEYVSSPEAVIPEKLVLVDGAPAGFKDADYQAGATYQQIRTILLGIQEDRAKWADQFVRSLFKSQQGELQYKELANASLKTPTGAAIALLFDMFTGDRRPALLRIQTPTLIIVPDSNRLLGEYLQSKISGSKLEVVNGAGHALFLEKPQAFNQTLEAFLAGK
jgi:microsomal epoxide hydrolase